MSTNSKSSKMKKTRYSSDELKYNNLKFLKRLQNAKSSVVDVATCFKNEKMRDQLKRRISQLKNKEKDLLSTNKRNTYAK